MRNDGEKKIETDKLIKKIKRISGIALGLLSAGEWDKLWEIIEQGEESIRNFPGNLPRELEEPHCQLLDIKADLAIIRGNLILCFDTVNELLTVAENCGVKKYVANAFKLFAIYYWRSGDLDRALEYCNRSIILIEETCYNKKDLYSLYSRINAYSVAMRVAIDKGILELARNYFERLEKIYESSTEPIPFKNRADPFISIIIHQYNYNKGRILQLSMRARDRAMAEELFKEVIESRSDSFHKIEAFIGLCELLLVELKITGEMDVVNELKPQLEKLTVFAQELKSDRYLTEAYILQGKLALLTFDIKTARRFLIQAQRIAENQGFKGVAGEVARLHEDLTGKLDTWKRLEETNAPLSERIELAGIEDHLNGQFRKRIMKLEQVEQKKVTVYKDLKTCLVCKGNAGGFNIYVCPQCNSIYCKGCAKAVVEIENACWTCESPIDVSRPSKPFEQEELRKKQ